MGGFSARKGFLYQDLYLLFRVLRDASDSLGRAWVDGANDAFQLLNKSQTRYGIEASPRDSAADASGAKPGPDWDVLILRQSRLEFAEVKSGTISKDDRISFWLRLRRELSTIAQGAYEVTPVLVVDPDKAGDLTKWQELAATASQFSGRAPPAEPTNNVHTAAQLLDEALWWLCRPESSGNGCGPSTSLDSARNALIRFELHLHAAQQLNDSVSQFTELVFAGSLADTDQELLLGWLTRRATAEGRERRLFSIPELLADIGILEQAASLSVGKLKEWRDLWNEATQGVAARSHLQLGEAGESVPAAKVQPLASEALASGGGRSFVLLGLGGAGKSTFMAQAAHGAEQRGDIVLHCGADDVIPEELEILIRAFRFRVAMATIKSPGCRAFIFVDALDEAEPSLRKRWGQHLVRLASLANVSLIASIREGVWSSDAELGRLLGTWTRLTLGPWPEQLVRDLLKPTAYDNMLPASVITLLRTPILLDLFWRTFVESGKHDVSLAAQLHTRQSLLAVYWEQRLVHSPRYAAVRDLPLRLGILVSKVVGHIGPFFGAELDSEISGVLLSEGVLVREGRLQPRLRFRHPLLRDFAFAQWCLETENAPQAAERWNSIRGGLQRYGALRALFEALSDPMAAEEYPQLGLVGVVQAMVRSDSKIAGQVAQLMGTHEPGTGLDPAVWPPDVQSSLPANFGCQLLSAARLAGNGSWAARIEHWPDDAGWLGDEYSKEVFNYLSVLLERLKEHSSNGELREQCRQAARKLRQISEARCFSSDFNNYDRHLMMHALLSVIPILPDEASLSWVEREMARSSWRTRSQVLERLIYLAPVNPERVALIYRNAVGLTLLSGQHKINLPWPGVFDHHAIEWSLAGADGRRGLLKEYPLSFLPVALELAEALWHQKQESGNSSAARLSEIMMQFNPAWSETSNAEYERQRQQRLGGLIDDAADWSYWRAFPDQDARSRSLRAIHECAEQCAKSSLETFVSSLVPHLRRSPLASVQSILLDVLLKYPEQAGCANCILDCATDARLYQASGLDYWLERGLIVSWPIASDVQRTKILDIIAALLSLQGEEHSARHFLLRLPIEDLPAHLLHERPSEDDQSYEPYARPQHAGVTNFAGVQIGEEDERLIGRWPDDFDRESLLRFSRAIKDLANQGATPDKHREKLGLAIEAARPLATCLRSRRELLNETERGWVCQSLAELLQSFRKHSDDKQAPPEELVRDCADISVGILRDGPSEISGELSEAGLSRYEETPWTYALTTICPLQRK
jgi:hypothetical protein